MKKDVVFFVLISMFFVSCKGEKKTKEYLKDSIEVEMSNIEELNVSFPIIGVSNKTLIYKIKPSYYSENSYEDLSKQFNISISSDFNPILVFVN